MSWWCWGPRCCRPTLTVKHAGVWHSAETLSLLSNPPHLSPLTTLSWVSHVRVRGDTDSTHADNIQISERLRDHRSKINKKGQHLTYNAADNCLASKQHSRNLDIRKLPAMTDIPQGSRRPLYFNDVFRLSKGGPLAKTIGLGWTLREAVCRPLLCKIFHSAAKRLPSSSVHSSRKLIKTCAAAITDNFIMNMSLIQMTCHLN